MNPILHGTKLCCGLPRHTAPVPTNNTNIFRRTKALISELSMPPASSTDLHFLNEYSQSFWKQCLICLWKQNLSYWRNIHYTGRRFLVTIIFALIFATVFWNLGMKRWVFKYHKRIFSEFCSPHYKTFLYTTQNERTRLVQFHGVNVLSRSIARYSERTSCSASDFHWKDSVLQTKSSRNVLSPTLYICTGNLIHLYRGDTELYLHFSITAILIR